MAKKTLGYVELEWICPNCGVKNPGSQRTCSSCGAPQPQDVAFHQRENQQLIGGSSGSGGSVAAAEVSAGADIHCAFCNARNPATATVCNQCGADLKEGTRREAGQVIGAFKEGEVKQIPCPHCASPNPETAQTCAKCGGAMKGAPEPAAAVRAPAGKMPPMLIAAIVLVIVLICGIGIWFAVMTSRTSASSGVVQAVNWKRVIVIEGIAPVEHEDWQDVIPAEAEIQECHEQARDVRKEPAPNATEVCGTPYTVDTGTGKGEVVQDCEYHVYDTFCTYTTLDWTEVDRAVLRGDSPALNWPAPALQENQRLGERSEEFSVLFEAGGKTYPFKTGDEALFRQCAVGSKWTLNINAFDKVISIEPAK